jgi:hypothetical protein
MLDADLAELYQALTKRLNGADSITPKSSLLIDTEAHAVRLLDNARTVFDNRIEYIRIHKIPPRGGRR